MLVYQFFYLSMHFNFCRRSCGIKLISPSDGTEIWHQMYPCNDMDCAKFNSDNHPRNPTK